MASDAEALLAISLFEGTQGYFPAIWEEQVKIKIWGNGKLCVLVERSILPVHAIKVR